MILKLDIANLIGKIIWVSFYMIAILVIVIILGLSLYLLNLGLNFIILKVSTMTLF